MTCLNFDSLAVWLLRFPSICPMVVAASMVVGCAVVVDGREANELARRVTWVPPTSEQVSQQLDQWLSKQSEDASAIMQAKTAFAERPEGTQNLLDSTVAAIALIEPTAKQMLITCIAERTSPTAPNFALLHDEAADPWLRNNLRLYFGRWLAQHELYDEAVEYLDGLVAADVVDPASLLFYQAVCYHQLLDKTKFTSAVNQLLENENLLPQRYAMVARLMEADLTPVEEDSLDEIQRIMGDIRRRLFLGRAGKRVRDEEDDVIAKLDKLINKAEEQKKQQQNGGGGAASGSRAPMNPAQDSQAPAGGGPGNVDPKKIGHKSGWGNLPPKERQEALQQISKELPAHYREVIEEYFRKLAQDGDK